MPEADTNLTQPGEPVVDPNVAPETDPAKETPTYPAYMAQLPDKYKQDEYLAGFKSFGEVTDKLYEFKQQVEEYRPRPETPDAYEIARPEELPEGMTYDENFEKDMRKLAHDLGLSQDQAAGLMKAYNEREISRWNEGMQKIEGLRTESENALKEKYKADYNAKMETVVRAMKEFGSPELAAFLDIPIPGFGRPGDHPALFETFVKIGEALGETGFAPGSTPTDTNEPATDKEKTLREIYPSMKDVPMNPGDQSPAEVDEELKKLYPEM